MRLSRPGFLFGGAPALVLALLTGVALPHGGEPPAEIQGDRGYYQAPTVHGNTLVFSSESDLWSVPATGGVARRLTAHPLPEAHPHLSPDGAWIAFTARYEGSADVYRMPAAGGPVTRLTFEADDVRVEGWTPDGRVLYATQGVVGPSWSWVLRIVDPESGAVEELPLADAREGSFAPDGTLWFTRFGLEVTGDNARAYRGGAMAQLWRFRPGVDTEATRVAADHPGNLTRPMAWGGAVYLVSDADGVGNLWRLDPSTEALTQLTTHADFEVRGATLGDGRIAYQHGADLRILDLEGLASRAATGSEGAGRLVDIRLGSDRARTRTRWIEDPMNWLTSTDLAPAGDQVALTARGRLVIVGTGELRRIEPPLPPASRARLGAISPDGAWVYTVLDASAAGSDTAGGLGASHRPSPPAEQEIWRFPATGDGPGEPLTHDAAGHRVGMTLSPDGRHLAHWDRRGILYLLDLEAGTNEAIDSARGAGYRDVVWSPDSRLLALARFDTPVRRPQIVLFDLATRTPHTVTSDRYESYSPAFSPDGRWLWFLSDRTFNPTPGSPWGDRNLGPLFDQRTRLYALSLQPGNPFPLAPRTELGTPQPLSEDRAEGRPAGSSERPSVVWEGLAARLHEAPLPAGNYSGLIAARNRLYLVERAPGSGPALRTVELGTGRARLATFGEGITSAVPSADGSRLLVRRGNDLFLVPSGAQLPSDLTEARVRAGSWRIAIEPAEEWRQMFQDAWRMQRDFLFDAAFRGVDWAATRDRYAPLVERIGHRRELDDLLAQMVAELGILHSQVRTGDVPTDREIAQPAFLGGTFEPAPGGLRITHLYRTDPELPSERAPLARPGVDLREGDVVTRVNGRPVGSMAELVRLLSHQAGEQVRLDVRRQGAEGEEAVVVQPIGAARDAALRYSDWVVSRRDAVEAATEGRVGYLHLRAMGSGDMADFVREFYANIDRDGLIIDVRRNRGGNIDSWVIQRLLRRGWSFWQPPGSDPYWNMQQSFRGHLVVLVDPLTYSDGETFAAGVQTLGLAPLVGQRTAGAGVWLSDTNRLLDQGILRAAQTPQFDADGAWIVEGFGVEPDIEVENLPHATWQGRDAQLERAIEEVLRALADEPVTRPQGAPIAPFPAPAVPTTRSSPPAGPRSGGDPEGRR